MESTPVNSPVMTFQYMLHYGVWHSKQIGLIGTTYPIFYSRWAYKINDKFYSYAYYIISYVLIIWFFFNFNLYNLPPNMWFFNTKTWKYKIAGQLVEWFFTSQSTAMVMFRLSVHLTILFSWASLTIKAVNQYFMHILLLVNDNTGIKLGGD